MRVSEIRVKQIRVNQGLGVHVTSVICNASFRMQTNEHTLNWG